MPRPESVTAPPPPTDEARARAAGLASALLLAATLAIPLAVFPARAADLLHVDLVLDLDPATGSGSVRAEYRAAFAPGDADLPLSSPGSSSANHVPAPSPGSSSWNQIPAPSPGSSPPNHVPASSHAPSATAPAAAANAASAPPPAPLVFVSHTLAWSFAPSAGLVAADGVAYTSFSTDAWLPLPLTPRGADLIADRFTLALTLVLPTGALAVAPGVASLPTPRADGRVEHRFTVDEPIPAYLIGFAAGAFTERRSVVVRPDGSRVELRALYAPGLESPADQPDPLASTAAALPWLEDFTGARYPDPVYTQVVVPGGIAQEKASFALLGAETLAAADLDPSEAWFVIHELAHQWFGRLASPADWAENWLNEGFAVLATRLFLADRWGEERGAAELSRARTRYGRAREAGRDRPLRVPAWRTPGDSGGPLPYTKALLVIDRLRDDLGGAVFDAGIRRWLVDLSVPTARDSAPPRRATSESLVAALTAASDRDLSGFLPAWIDSVGDAPALLSAGR